MSIDVKVTNWNLRRWYYASPFQSRQISSWWRCEILGSLQIECVTYRERTTPSLPRCAIAHPPPPIALHWHNRIQRQRESQHTAWESWHEPSWQDPYKDGREHEGKPPKADCKRIIAKIMAFQHKQLLTTLPVRTRTNKDIVLQKKKSLIDSYKCHLSSHISHHFTMAIWPYYPRW